MLFADCVMTSRIVIGGIFFPCEELFRIEKLTVCARTNLICKGSETRCTWLLMKGAIYAKIARGVCFNMKNKLKLEGSREIN